MFNNCLKLIRFTLRRERIVTPIWLISIIGFTVILAPALYEIYGSEAERQAMATTVNNPAMIAMMGPAYGIDNYTIGAMFGNMMLLWMAVVVAMMNIFFVVRHSRADEELGRLELIRSLPVGRLSKLSATLILAVVFNVIIAIFTGLGLAAMGIETIDLEGSLLFGAVLGVVGIVYAAITALFAQLASTSRGALGYSFTFLIIDYMVRAVGDISSETLARISPLGLSLRTQVYVNNYWWPIFILVAEAIVIGFIAFYLLSIRDMDSGMIPQRPGRKGASVFLQNYFGLSWRLLRNSVIAWSIGIFVIAAAYGSIFGDIEGFLASNEFFQQAFDTNGEGSLAEQFIPFLMTVTALISAIPVIMCALKIRTEEKHDYLDQIFARSVSRYKVITSYAVNAFISSALILFLNAFGFWLASSSVLDDPISFATFASASMVYLPTLWVMIGIALFLVAYFPSLTSLAWIYLLYSFLAVYFGQILDFPEWMSQLSPFGHVPHLPTDDMTWGAMIVLTMIAAALVVVSFVGYRRRDLR